MEIKLCSSVLSPDLARLHLESGYRRFNSRSREGTFPFGAVCLSPGFHFRFWHYFSVTGAHQPQNVERMHFMKEKTGGIAGRWET